MGITNKCSIYVWCIWNILFIDKNRQPTCAIDNVCSTHLILTFIKNNDMTLKHTYYFFNHLKLQSLPTLLCNKFKLVILSNFLILSGIRLLLSQ